MTRLGRFGSVLSAIEMPLEAMLIDSGRDHSRKISIAGEWRGVKDTESGALEQEFSSRG